MEATITFNVETVRRVILPDDLRVDPNTIKVPATTGGVKLNQPELIQAYIRDAMKEKESEFSLSPVTNQICAIAVKINDLQTDSLACNNELELLNFFSDIILTKQTNQTAKLVGFNSKSFDLPTLMSAHIRHNLIFPILNYSALISKYYENYHTDVRNVLTGYDSHGKGRLGDWCSAFGLPRPFGFGSMVQTWFDAGDWESIQEHCGTNVDCTYELYKKIERYVL